MWRYLVTLITSLLIGASQIYGSGFQEPIEIEGRGFSIQPPEGWEVKKNFNGASLFFQAPVSNDDEYKRNIRIIDFQWVEIHRSGFLRGVCERNSRKIDKNVQCRE